MPMKEKMILTCSKHSKCGAEHSMMKEEAAVLSPGAAMHAYLGCDANGLGIRLDHHPSEAHCAENSHSLASRVEERRDENHQHHKARQGDASQQCNFRSELWALEALASRLVAVEALAAVAAPLTAEQALWARIEVGAVAIAFVAVVDVVGQAAVPSNATAGIRSALAAGLDVGALAPCDNGRAAREAPVPREKDDRLERRVHRASCSLLRARQAVCRRRMRQHVAAVKALGADVARVGGVVAARPAEAVVALRRAVDCGILAGLAGSAGALRHGALVLACRAVSA